MRKQINLYTFERISQNMAKRFGTIKKGGEDDYSYLLLSMESNLLKANRKLRVNNGKRAIEAIHVCLLKVDGYLNQIEYDLDEHITDDNKFFVDALLMSFDPFTNDEVFPIVEQQYQVDSPADLQEYFKIPVMCLLRVEKSIEFWTKELGTNGYFSFFEGQMGKHVLKDDKMTFSVLKREAD